MEVGISGAVEVENEGTAEFLFDVGEESSWNSMISIAVYSNNTLPCLY